MADVLPLVAYPDLEGRVKAIEEDGFVYFPGVLNAEEIAELRDAMDRLTQLPESFDRHNTPENGGFLNKHINNAFNRDAVFLQYLDKPAIIELEEAIHGDDCHVIGMTAWTTGARTARSGVTYRLAADQPAGRCVGGSAGEGANFYHDRAFLP